MPGFVPNVTIGRSFATSIVDFACRTCAPGSVGSERQRFTAASQAAPCGASGRPGHVLVGRVVGRDHARARAGLDRHVADRHALFHRQRADRAAAVLDHVTGAAADADRADDLQDHVLGGDVRSAAVPSS